MGNVILIDRSEPIFTKLALVEEGALVAHEQDERSLALTQLDLAEVQLVHTIKKTEIYISGHENLTRLKKLESIRLDAYVFESVFQNLPLIPELWKQRTREYPTIIYFWGTVFKNKKDNLYVPYISLCSNGEWGGALRCLDFHWYFGCPAAQK